MKICFIEGVLKGQAFDYSDLEFISIGRDSSNDINIQDSKSSRHHAQILKDDNQYFINDQQSTNGTYLNETLVEKKTSLKHSDIIRIGDSSFQILFKDSSIQESSSVLNMSENNSSTMVITAIPQNKADILLDQEQQKQYDDLIFENKILRKICEISQIVATNRDTQETLGHILNTLETSLDADMACIVNWDSEKNEWIQRALSTKVHLHSPMISQTIIKKAISDGMALLCRDPLSDNRFDPSASIISQNISSAICAPLMMNEKEYGVLFIDRRNRKNSFNDQDLKLSASVANILALVLENEKLFKEAKRKEFLAAIGEVIAGLAHYTKNIITGLRFSIHAMEIMVKKNNFEGIQRTLKSILIQERRISELVLNMLSYSKDRKPMREQFDLIQIIKDVIEPYETHLKDKNIQLNFDFEKEVIFINADETSIYRVFLNLLLNSIDSFKKIKDRKKIINIQIKYTQNDELLILFKDNGCGISDEKLKNVFNVFYSTKGSEGTGLGLAVVQKIIHEHQGHILVTSEENKFTQFEILLKK